MHSRTMEYEPTSSPALTLYQRAVLGLLLLLATAGGTLAVTAWRAVDEFAAQEAARRSDLKDFHKRLVSEVSGLAEKSGMLNSADLCPVRFRFRFPNSYEPPGRPIHALLQSGDSDWRGVDVRTNMAGIAEFGLVPPGAYTLTATTDDGYSLEHEFTVLPGVPVDRLVLCPQSSNHDFQIGLQMVWPESLCGRNLDALYEVERDDVRAGEWTWAPRDRDCLLVMGPAAHEPTQGIDDLAGLWLETAELDTDVVTSIPHRYCRMLRIHVWQEGSDGGPATELATFAYRAVEEVGGACPSDIALTAPCPRYESSLNLENDKWVVALPHEAEATLRRSLGLDADTSYTPSQIESVPATP